MFVSLKDHFSTGGTYTYYILYICILASSQRWLTYLSHPFQLWSVARSFVFFTFVNTFSGHVGAGDVYWARRCRSLSGFTQSHTNIMRVTAPLYTASSWKYFNRHYCKVKRHCTLSPEGLVLSCCNNRLIVSSSRENKIQSHKIMWKDLQALLSR